jgi:SPP1 gp7 family putative phage head morphogenesis protein
MDRTLARRGKRNQTLDPVRPNVGIEAAYRKALDEAIREMHESILYWLRAGYRANEPEVLAMDKSPARELDERMQRLTRRWQRNFDRPAPKLAKYFATAATQRADAGMQAALRKAGFTVKFKMTAAANDAFQAVVAENVGLIKSIAQEHLQDVQGILMRSVASGRDLGTMTKELEARYAVTRRRATLIARDQNNKASAVITRVRQKEVGVTEAVWLHSHGGKHPRPSHVAADGKKYDIDKGMWIDGEWILPGQKINCRCLSKAVVPGLS